MLKLKYITVSIILLAMPTAVFALSIPAIGLTLPTSANQLAEMSGIDAKSYLVQDVDSGEIIISKNSDVPWTPASLTKLVTALVVLDKKVPITKTVAMTAVDQVAGWCTSGGVCIKTKPGVKFTVDGLFHAALMPSANNAANALARSTGLSTAQFADLMNKKAASLGATGSHFNEPTGMDPDNKITAQDYAKILAAAFQNSYLSGIAQLTNYALRSSNNSGYNQTIKNNDKLVNDPDVQILGAKTGYLYESNYNFSALLKTDSGQKLAVVVLGEKHLYTAFEETKQLVSLAKDAHTLALLNSLTGLVLGESTTTTNNLGAFVGLQMPQMAINN